MQSSVFLLGLTIATDPNTRAHLSRSPRRSQANFFDPRTRRWEPGRAWGSGQRAAADDGFPRVVGPDLGPPRTASDRLGSAVQLYQAQRHQIPTPSVAWNSGWLRRLDLISGDDACQQFQALLIEAEHSTLSAVREQLLTELWQGLWVEITRRVGRQASHLFFWTT